MMPPTHPMVSPVVDNTGHIAITYCNQTFAFTPVHPMRRAKCVICRDLIGGQPATVIGAVALCGDACDCGAVTSEAFLAHASHFPLPPAELQAALTIAISCYRSI